MCMTCNEHHQKSISFIQIMGVSKIETWIFQSFQVLKCNSPGIPESPGACLRGKLLWTFNWHRYQKTKQMVVRKRETALKHDCCILVSPFLDEQKPGIICLVYCTIVGIPLHLKSYDIKWQWDSVRRGGIIRSIKRQMEKCVGFGEYRQYRHHCPRTHRLFHDVSGDGHQPYFFKAGNPTAWSWTTTRTKIIQCRLAVNILGTTVPVMIWMFP